MLTPMAVPGLGPAIDISVGGTTCALLMDRTVKCWGGLLGSAPGFADYRPALIPDLTDVVAIHPAAGLSALRADSSTAVLAGWGWNVNPQRNQAAVRTRRGARQITGPSSGSGSLVVMNDGYLDFDPYVAIGDPEDTRDGGLSGRNYTSEADVVYAAPAADYACVLTSANVVECVGDNSHGQLGDGTTTSRARFVPVLWPNTSPNDP